MDKCESAINIKFWNIKLFFSVAVSVCMLHTIILHLPLSSTFWWKDGARHAPLKARAHKWSCDERLSRSLIKNVQGRNTTSVFCQGHKAFCCFQTTNICLRFYRLVFDPEKACLLTRWLSCWLELLIGCGELIHLHDTGKEGHRRGHQHSLLVSGQAFKPCDVERWPLVWDQPGDRRANHQTQHWKWTFMETGGWQIYLHSNI